MCGPTSWAAESKWSTSLHLPLLPDLGCSVFHTHHRGPFPPSAKKNSFFLKLLLPCSFSPQQREKQLTRRDEKGGGKWNKTIGQKCRPLLSNSKLKPCPGSFQKSLGRGQSPGTSKRQWSTGFWTRHSSSCVSA